MIRYLLAGGPIVGEGAEIKRKKKPFSGTEDVGQVANGTPASNNY